MTNWLTDWLTSWVIDSLTNTRGGHCSADSTKAFNCISLQYAFPDHLDLLEFVWYPDIGIAWIYHSMFREGNGMYAMSPCSCAQIWVCACAYYEVSSTPWIHQTFYQLMFACWLWCATHLNSGVEKIIAFGRELSRFEMFWMVMLLQNSCL